MAEVAAVDVSALGVACAGEVHDEGFHVGVEDELSSVAGEEVFDIFWDVDDAVASVLGCDFESDEAEDFKFVFDGDMVDASFSSSDVGDLVGCEVSELFEDLLEFGHGPSLTERSEVPFINVTIL